MGFDLNDVLDYNTLVNMGSCYEYGLCVSSVDTVTYKTFLYTLVIARDTRGVISATLNKRDGDFIACYKFVDMEDFKSTIL